MALEPGQVIDAKYKVIRLIGEGGMGTVYEGENMRIARRVAIKVLHAQVAAMSDFVARFEREARAVARIGSQYVCDVLDLGDLPNGDRYIVMEYLDGISFEDRLTERGKLTPAQLAPIAFELLEGLGTMHVAGVIHRDLKPANVFLSRTSGGRGEVVKILDFGVAKLQPLAGEVGSMTQTGTMMGTPLYMSPEQARGARDVDGRTDLYAASVMFYRALAGQLPYNAETLNELLFKIVLEDPRPLREVAPEVDEVFAAIVHKGLARELPQRFQSARAFQDEIAAWAKTQERSSLSFAATHASDRPPATPITLPELSRMSASSSSAMSAGVGAPIASAVSAAAGTPIAWSESAPGHPNSSKMVAATVLTPISSQPQSSLVAGVGLHQGPGTPAGSAPNAAPSNATLSSSVGTELSTSRASPELGGAIANAQTAPVVPLADADGRAGANPASRSSRGLIFGLVAGAAVAVVAFVAFGRGSGAEKPPAIGITAAVPASAPLAPIDSASTSAAQSATAAVPSAIAEGDGATAAPQLAAGRKDPGNAPALRRTDQSPKPTTAATTTTAAPVTSAAVAQSPATAPSATTAKPASSARKFRTNLD